MSQKTAWFILHRVREMLKNKNPNLLQGIIEVDETLVGGLEANKHTSKRTAGTQGRSTAKKTAQVYCIEAVRYALNPFLT